MPPPVPLAPDEIESHVGFAVAAQAQFVGLGVTATVPVEADDTAVALDASSEYAQVVVVVDAENVASFVPRKYLGI